MVSLNIQTYGEEVLAFGLRFAGKIKHFYFFESKQLKQLRIVSKIILRRISAVI